ncbi:hypothetical protein ABZR37_10290 [Achromobacter ruhlandii]|uniref:hypothetical protein n=1 Tax=Pseudomonadota TaxID=1224 RepID=UPI0015A4AA54|nr:MULTISPECIES: hypothetical protein [Pseudomonas]MCS8129804.1 hypothetical protein [Pseudomonas aeruginosa]MCS9139038.1 hypothetical protein [Pseudomonas aeruginosa]MCS9211981.1 hypothetical protein [Pseudomonas aeruginosa]NWC42773.1 hypothetical protein [Pseudomonas tolaasii]WLP05886.1 hypothetical protein Q8015_00300 [Pseudomonas putida]
MDIKEIREIDLKHVSAAAAALIQHIESILSKIPSERVRQLVAMKLTAAISEGGNEKLLRQILLLAVTAIEKSELIEHKIATNDVEFNPITGEIMSELNVIPAVDAVIKVMKEVKEKTPPKSAQKPANPQRSGEQ